MTEGCNQNCVECDFDMKTSSNLAREVEAKSDILSKYPTEDNPANEKPFMDVKGGPEKLESTEMQNGLEKHFLNATVSHLCQWPGDVCNSSSSSDETKEQSVTHSTLVYQYERKGRLYKMYNFERCKSLDVSSSVSNCQILDHDSKCQTIDGNPRPLKRKKFDSSTRCTTVLASDENKKEKSVQEIDIFEVERRMLNDRLFHRYFEYNKVRGTPIWRAFEPVAQNDEPYSTPTVESDSMNTLRGSINKSTNGNEGPDIQTTDKPSAVQELRKRFEDFQSGKSSGDNKSEKEGLQDLLNRAAAEFTGNIEDIDPELIEQGKKYLKSKGVKLGDLMSVAGSHKFSLRTMISIMKPVLYEKISRRNNVIVALGVSALLGILVITVSASHGDQLWRNLILTNIL